MKERIEILNECLQDQEGQGHTVESIGQELNIGTFDTRLLVEVDPELQHDLDKMMCKGIDGAEIALSLIESKDRHTV